LEKTKIKMNHVFRDIIIYMAFGLKFLIKWFWTNNN